MPQSRAQRKSARLLILPCGLVMSILLISILAANVTVQVRAAVVISKSDATKGPPRGSPETALHFAQTANSTRFADTRDYIYEIYRMAPLVGIDPAFVVSQSALETADWTSFYWTNHLNPAGIGITHSGAPSFTWPTGTSAARFHLARLYVYVAGPIDAGNPLYPYRNDGPDYSHLFDLGYDGSAQIIDDLTGKWATDPVYGQKIANRGNEIFGIDGPLSPAMLVVAVDASGGSDPNLTRDGDITSTWVIEGIGNPPTGGYISFDLGRPITFELIQWRFSQAGSADDYDVQTSDDGLNWITLATFSESQADSWIPTSAAGTARYVRFLFRNPTGDVTLGFLAEVEFYGANASGQQTATSTPYPSPSSTNTPMATATGTPTPGQPTPTRTPSALPGVAIPIRSSGGSGIGTSSRAVRDGSLTSTWQTSTTYPPNSAQVYVDLGDVGTITGVEFMFRRSNGARLYQIRVSSDKRDWTTVATLNYVSPLQWQRARFTTSARYVQFVFTNTNGTAVLGYIAEIRVFGSLGTFEVANTTANPTAVSTSTSPSPTSTSTTTAIATETAIPTASVIETIADDSGSPIAIGHASPMP